MVVEFFDPARLPDHSGHPMARLGDRQSTFRFMGYERTGLWADVLGLPDALATTLEAADWLADAVGLLRAPGVERVVATGNGAAYYVAHGLWLASLEGNGAGPPLILIQRCILCG